MGVIERKIAAESIKENTGKNKPRELLLSFTSIHNFYFLYMTQTISNKVLFLVY